MSKNQEKTDWMCYYLHRVYQKDEHKNINTWQINGAVHAHCPFVVHEMLSQKLIITFQHALSYSFSPAAS